MQRLNPIASRDLADKDDMSSITVTTQASGGGGDGAASGAGPLSDEHLRAIREAKARRGVLDKAAGVATFNGWTIGTLAAMSAPFAPFSVSGAVVFVGLAAVAYTEFRGRAMLRRLDERGPRVLGMNQVALGVLIVGYCVWTLYGALTGPSAYAEAVAAEPALAGMLGDVDELYRVAAMAVYGGGAVLTVPYQAAMAWYYFSRGRQLRAYVAQTPGWVTELEQEGLGVRG